MIFPKMDKAKVAEIIREGRVHLRFMIKIYKKQMAKGRYFVHEHPATAVPWDEKETVSL